MVHKHISRDYSQHEKSIIRPSDDYCMFEVFAYDPSYTKTYTVKNNSFKPTGCTRTTWKSWTCYRSSNPQKSMNVSFNYNFKTSGTYHIEILYEQSSIIWTGNNKKYNTSRDIVGTISTSLKGKEDYNQRVTFDGENNILKRQHIYRDFTKGNRKITVTIPSNCYLLGVIVRKVKYLYGDNIDSAGSDFQFTSATLTQSDMTKPSELSVTIGYDDDFECWDNPSGFYMDYMNECNLYVKDTKGKKVRIFGGYISSILPDEDRTKITISCADRLRDGSNKYILDELILQDGATPISENEYIGSMEKNFPTRTHALKYICNAHETTLKNNISKNYLVSGEKYNAGIILTWGTNKKIKKVTCTNGTSTPQKNYITLRNNNTSTKEQYFNIYNAKDHAKVPLEFTKYPYFQVTYGLGEPKTEIKSQVTETVETAETKAGSQKFTKCGVSADGKYLMAIGLPSASRDSKKGWTKTVFERKCPHCGSTNLIWDWNWGSYSQCRGAREGGSVEGHIFCKSCDADYSVQGFEHINGSNYNVKKVSSVMASSRAEAQKLKNGQMVAVPKTGVSVSTDEIFKAITKIAFKYKYKLGGGVSSYSAMKKSGYGDCWAFSELIFEELKKYKVSVKIVQYATQYASNHRTAMYVNDKGQWVDFPYREYGWNTRYHNMLNNTAGSSRGSVIKSYKGSRIGSATVGSTSTTKTQTTTVTTLNGYDKDKPPQFYFEIVYSTKQSWKAKKYKLYIDFTQSAKSSNGLTGLPCYWINKSTRKSSLDWDIVAFLQQHHGANARFFLHSIRLITPKKAQKQGEDTDWYKYDKSTIDNASCKMDLYQIVFNDRSMPNPSDLNSCGKSVNNLLGEIVGDTNYLVNMTYGLHRKDDVVNFRLDNDSKVRFHATEGDNNNILSWNSISYTPISSLFNSSVQVFKGYDEKYHYVDSKYPDSILKYQEQCTLATSTETIGDREAYWNATHQEKFNPNQSYNYSIVVPNYVNLRIGDMVKVTANSKKLNTVKTVESIKISYDIGHMPRIQTELGLGELSPDLMLKENIRKLRRNAQKETTYFSCSASPVTDETVYSWDN